MTDAATAGIPRVEKDQLGDIRLRLTLELADLFGDGVGVEVAAENRRVRAATARLVDELADRARLELANVALIKPPVEVRAKHLEVAARTRDVSAYSRPQLVEVRQARQGAPFRIDDRPPRKDGVAHALRREIEAHAGDLRHVITAQCLCQRAWLALTVTRFPDFLEAPHIRVDISHGLENPRLSLLPRPKAPPQIPGGDAQPRLDECTGLGHRPMTLPTLPRWRVARSGRVRSAPCPRGR